MNRILITMCIGLMAVALDGCARPASNANGASTTGASAAANTAASAKVGSADNRNGSAASGNVASISSQANANSNPADAGALDSSRLVGAYDLNQIQKGGVTTMMSKTKVQLVFTADGRYSRVIVTNGKMVHNESGQFSVAGDKLTFSVVLTGKTINKTPKVKDYTVALSPDGRQLKLTSPTGETAVFNRAS